MQKMIRRLDEKKVIANPYLQPFQPNAFFQWANIPVQPEPVVVQNILPTQNPAEITMNPYQQTFNDFAPPLTESVAVNAAPLVHSADEASLVSTSNQMVIPNIAKENPPSPNHPALNFTNHPLFPPYPMNETQWQQYQENPRPPLNPYPTHPYPSVAKATKQAKETTTGPLNNFMTHFKTIEGGYDFPKIMNTAGSMLNSMNQISTIAKSIGGLFLGK